LQVARADVSWLHPGRSGVLQLGPQNRLALFGEIHPRVLQAMDVKGPVVAFEAFLDAVPEPKSRSATRPPLHASDLMPVTRDFAFIVDEGVEAEKIVRAARGADRQLIEAVSVFDVFSGGALG